MPPSARSIATDRATFSATIVGGPEIVLGAFQRRKSALTNETCAVTRRASGGPALVVDAGSVHVILALPRADAVVADADARRAVNRHVRPLLRALTRVGAPAAYFGRDVVTVAKRAVAWVGFAHHAASGATVFEAFVAVDVPFALPLASDAAPLRRELPYAGKAGTLCAALGRSFDPRSVAEAIASAYLAAYPDVALVERLDHAVRAPEDDRRAPFSASVEAPIGFVQAIAEGDDIEVGGELLASEDLVVALSSALASRDIEAVAALLTRHPGVIEGARADDVLTACRIALESPGHDDAREGR